jgi:GNAT superfamily N-acetyltransferase
MIEGANAARRRVEPLARHHDRDAFASGEPALDLYIKRQASQDVKRRVAAVFVLVGDTPEMIAGFYTLSAHALALGALPAAVAEKLPRYPEIPTLLLGRLARDLRFRGQGIGELLLFDALKRALGSSRALGAFAVVVDATNERAAQFYLSYGFQPVSDRPSRLFLPMATVERLLPEVGA